MKPTTKKISLGIMAAVSAVLLSSCGLQKFVEPFQDAPRGKVYEDAADIVIMPDGFSNIATKCGAKGMRFTSAYHGDSQYGSITVTPDPTCN